MARIDIKTDKLLQVQGQALAQSKKASDSLRVIGAIKDQIAKTQTDLTKDMLISENYSDSLSVELTEKALEIQNLKEHHRDLTNTYDNFKIKIEPYTFSQYADPYEKDDGFEYESGEYMRSSKFMNNGGTYTIQEAEDMVFDLDEQIYDLHETLLRTAVEHKSSGVYEQTINNRSRTSALMDEFDNYPRLFGYLIREIDSKDHPSGDTEVWNNSLTLPNWVGVQHTRIKVKDNNGNDIPVSQQSWYGEGHVNRNNSTSLPRINAPFLDTRLRDKDSKIRSFTYEGPTGYETEGRKFTTETDGYVGEAHPIKKTWGEWWQGEYQPEYSQNTRSMKVGDRADVLYNREKAIVEKLVDMQWLMLQKHKILCQTDGGYYCDLLQGESRDEDLLNEVIKNDNRIFEVEQEIRAMGGDFNDMKNVMTSELGFTEQDFNLNEEDIIQSQLTILNSAMTDLEQEAASQNDLYITQDMKDFVADLKNNPEALLKLFHTITKK